MSDALHTVAVYVPGTQTRVLVDRLGGSPADAIDLAREVLGEIVRTRHRLTARVVRSDHITDVLSPPETT